MRNIIENISNNSRRYTSSIRNSNSKINCMVQVQLPRFRMLVV